VGYVGLMVEKTDSYKVLVGKPENEGHLEDLGVDGRLILEWILKKSDGMT
jgi:hypothetical protein